MKKGIYIAPVLLGVLLVLSLTGCRSVSQAVSTNAPPLTEQEKKNFGGAPATPEERAAHFKEMQAKWQAMHPNQVLRGPGGVVVQK